jgi:hypothetical protein
MTTIIERPEGGGSGMIVLAAIVGALAVAVIGMFALGGFDGGSPTTAVTIEQPAAPAVAPEAAPAAPSTPAPAETAPSTEPAPAPDATDAEPAEPPAPPQE